MQKIVSVARLLRWASVFAYSSLQKQDILFNIKSTPTNH